MELMLFIYVVVAVLLAAIVAERRAEKRLEHQPDERELVLVHADPNRQAARERFDWGL
jgi:hypothetical protein